MADSELPATATLLMDRGIPIGNSLGSDNRRALHTRVTAGKLVTEAFDSIFGSYPDGVTEVYDYYYLGNHVASVTVTYTDGTKDFIASVVKT